MPSHLAALAALEERASAVWLGGTQVAQGTSGTGGFKPGACQSQQLVGSLGLFAEQQQQQQQQCSKIMQDRILIRAVRLSARGQS